jgi:outer membrane cobalamin receptor
MSFKLIGRAVALSALAASLGLSAVTASASPAESPRAVALSRAVAVVDGHVLPSALPLRALEPTAVARLQVIAGDQSAKYGPRAAYGVIEIALKPQATETAGMPVYIDGQRLPAGVGVNAIAKTWVARIDVFNKDVSARFGPDAAHGAIQISLKEPA